MILVGATNDERYLVFHLGDDISNNLLFSAKLSPDRAEALVEQMLVVIKALNRTPIPEKPDSKEEPNVENTVFNSENNTYTQKA